MIQMDNDPKHTAKATQEFIKAKKWKILEWPSQSPDPNPTEHAFHLLKTKLRTERPTNKQQLKAAAVKAWKSIKKEETQHLVMSMSSRLQAVIASKGFSTKY
ncbi:TCB1 transposase, partial [Polypterus senegalus]